jgi:hypothetical protein
MSFDSFYFYTMGNGISKRHRNSEAMQKSNDQETCRQGCPRDRRLARHRRGQRPQAEAVVKELTAKGVEARAFKADQASPSEALRRA